jgi:tRNA 2-thiouridine synthesizing protein A
MSERVLSDLTMLTGFSGTQSTNPDMEVDITREVCPMTFVRTRLALDRLQPGQTLLVRLQGAEPLQNVPLTAAGLGHQVLSLTPQPDGSHLLLLRRK